MNDKTSEKTTFESSKSEQLKPSESSKAKLKHRLVKYYKPALKILLIVGPPIVIVFTLVYYFSVYLSPKAILARNIKNLGDVTSLKYNAEADINFTNTNYETSKEISPESNILKIIQPASYKVTGEGVLNFNDNNLQGDSNFRISSNGEDVANLYLKNRNDEYFLKLSDFSYSNYVDKSLIETWIKINSKFLEDRFGIKLFSGSDNGKNREEALNNFQVTPPIELIDRFPSDKVKGMDAYHYKFRLNSKNFVKDFNLGESSPITKIDFEDGDVWLGKKKNSVFRINISGEVKGVGAEGTTLELRLDVTFYDINYENKLDFPDNYVDVTQLLR